METVKVPLSVMFEGMMKKLNLPSPKFETVVVGVNSFDSKVMFYPSTEFLLSSAQPHVLSSYFPEEKSMEEAIDGVAYQALKYMKSKEKKILKERKEDTKRL